MITFDTNVFVYAVDANEPRKQSIARQLIDTALDDGEEIALLWQVACEFLACLRRWQNDGRMTEDEVGTHIRRIIMLFGIQIPSRSVIESSLKLHERYSLSHWDSLLLAACIDAGVATLYTKDLDAGTAYESVSVINPF